MSVAWRTLAERGLLISDRAVRSVRRAPRRRLALVTPWPPDQSGVAVYSRRLARALGRHVDVDVVVDGALADREQPLDPGVRLISTSTFTASRWLHPHDRVLYCMGNSRFHRHVYELLRERRGAVLMHDVQLTGFYGYYAGVERPQDPLGALVERVRRQYGARIPPDELGTAPLDAERRVALGIYLTEEVQRHAEQLLVHSRDARALLQADGRGLQTRVPISIVPHALPAAQEGAQRSGAASSPVVVHLGALSDEKSLAVLIRAFARFAAGQPAARLVIAGPADSSERARWQQFAGEQAPGASVEIPGRVDECRYRALLARADLAVQLRSVSNGEASGATADCLAAGVPTIVTDLGWSGELPADTVALTPAGVSPEALSELMTALTLDTPRRTALSERALALGGRWSFEHVASEVIGALAL